MGLLNGTGTWPAPGTVDCSWVVFRQPGRDFVGDEFLALRQNLAAKVRHRLRPDLGASVDRSIQEGQVLIHRLDAEAPPPGFMRDPERLRGYTTMYHVTARPGRHALWAAIATAKFVAGLEGLILDPATGRLMTVADPSFIAVPLDPPAAGHFIEVGSEGDLWITRGMVRFGRPDLCLDQDVAAAPYLLRGAADALWLQDHPPGRLSVDSQTIHRVHGWPPPETPRSTEMLCQEVAAPPLPSWGPGWPRLGLLRLIPQSGMFMPAPPDPKAELAQLQARATADLEAAEAARGWLDRVREAVPPSGVLRPDVEEGRRRLYRSVELLRSGIDPGVLAELVKHQVLNADGGYPEGEFERTVSVLSSHMMKKDSALFRARRVGTSVGRELAWLWVLTVQAWSHQTPPRLV